MHYNLRLECRQVGIEYVEYLKIKINASAYNIVKSFVFWIKKPAKSYCKN